MPLLSCTKRLPPELLPSRANPQKCLRRIKLNSIWRAVSTNNNKASRPCAFSSLFPSSILPFFWSSTDDDTHLQTLFARPVWGNWGFSSGGTFALRAGGRSARVPLCPHHLVRFLISGPHKVGGRCCLMWPQGNTFRHEIPAQMSLTARRPLVSAVAFLCERAFWSMRTCSKSWQTGRHLRTGGESIKSRFFTVLRL